MSCLSLKPQACFHKANLKLSTTEYPKSYRNLSPPLQANPSTISPSIIRIALIVRDIIAKQPLRTLRPRKPPTGRRILGDADPRQIASLAAAVRQTGVVLARRLAVALGRVGPEAAAVGVRVCESAGPLALVQVGAVGGVGLAVLVFGTGCYLEAAWSAGFVAFGGGDGCEAEGSCEEGLEEHDDILGLNVSKR